MTPELFELLQNAIAAGNNGPCLKDGDTTYVRYTGLTIRAKEKPERGFLGARQYYSDRFVLEFLLGNTVVERLEVKNVLFETGDSLTLKNMNGLFEIVITGVT